VGARRAARELVLQALYSLDHNPAALEDTVVLTRDEEQVSGPARAFADELLIGVTGNLASIDQRIQELSKNWTLARIGRIELAILRLAAFELIYRADIPANVTINEAIEIAKRYGTEDSPAFINGILDELSSSLTEKRPQP
jgi:N utilization substance protein B